MNHSKRWLVQSYLTPEAEVELGGFPTVMQHVLFNRGYATQAGASAYLRAVPGFNTSPWGLKGMPACVERIGFAIDHDETIAIYGDYDVDGVTATALLVQALQTLGANVLGYIPNRFEEGYGLNKEALDSLMEQGVKLVVTVDCGIRSPEETAHALKAGLDLIISDHHSPAGQLPEAFAIINPKQADDCYPDKDLAGVGLAYKIASALLERRPIEAFDITSLLDLVALGTVADLAPLINENRSLVRLGLQEMRRTRRQGLFSLAAVSDLGLDRVNAGHIGYVLGPRLNAAGRLDSALAALELLITGDVIQAGRLAQQLDVQNRERQALTRDIQEKAEVIALEGEQASWLLIAVDQEFNPGVVGLAAARLMEAYYRPAIVGHVGQDTTRCSCRSIPEFHITRALDECEDLLVRHGGHAAAAGFTVKNEKMAELVERLKTIAERELAGQDLRPTLTADAEVSLYEMKPGLLRYFDELQPTGYGNPEATFISRNLRVINCRPVGPEGRHLKLTVSDGKIAYDAIAFRQGYWADQMPENIDLLYVLELNEYNGRESLQLNVKDIKPSNIPA